MAAMGESPETKRLERWVHRSLLAGLAVSGVLLLAGLAVALARGEKTPPTARVSSWAAVRHLARTERATALLNLGLIALVATPVVRVIVLGTGWAVNRDWRFAAVALVVLVLLGLSLVLGFG